MALNITPRRPKVAAETTIEAPATELEAAIAADTSEEAAKPSRRRTSTRTRSTSTRTTRAKKTDEEETSSDDDATDEKPRSTSRRRGTSTRSRATKADDTTAETEAESAPSEDDAKPARRSSSRSTAVADGDLVARLDRQGKELERQEKALDRQSRDIAELQKLQREILDKLGGTATSTARVGIFVDVANVELAIDKLNRRVSWTKVLKKVSKDRNLVCAVAYSPVHEDINVSMESQRFTEPFVNQGFRMVTKPLKKFSDGTVKANVDIEMTIEILEMLDRLDVLCLASGDGDFEPLVKTAQKRGVKVEVISVGQATAMALKRASDQFIDLANILNEVGV
jgi:uncharacterized protein (TIGR00288 family)